MPRRRGPVAVTPKMRALEARHGKRIRPLLRTAYKRTGSVRGAAAELGLDPSTVLRWMRKLAIPTPRWEPVGGGTAQPEAGMAAPSRK